MKNKKGVIAAIVIGCQCWLVLIWIGIRTMHKYSDNPGNWHFIAALTGTILTIGLLGISLVGIYIVLFPERFQNFLLNKK